ncbi:MAG: hypothetical protein AB8H86_21130 [Polyangiales bacterium]
MRGWRIWAVEAFVIGLAAAMFVYIRTRPAVTEEELREAVAELEDIPALLSELESAASASRRAYAGRAVAGRLAD